MNKEIEIIYDTYIKIKNKNKNKDIYYTVGTNIEIFIYDGKNIKEFTILFKNIKGSQFFSYEYNTLIPELDISYCIENMNMPDSKIILLWYINENICYHVFLNCLKNNFEIMSFVELVSIIKSQFIIYRRNLIIDSILE